MNKLRRFIPQTWKSGLVSFAIFAATFALYHSNGPYPLGSFDSAPNSLLADNMLTRRTLDFDVLRDGYLMRSGASYAFVEAPNGHLTSLYPIGTAIVTFPLYAAIHLRRIAFGERINIAAAAFEPVRELDEKAVATTVGALAVVLFFLCARMIGSGFAAGLASAGFATGTEMWTIGSQALWQHGSVCLMLLAMIAAMLRAIRAPSDRGQARWILAAGLCAGLAVAVRPTAILFAAAVLVFAGLRMPRFTLRFVAAAAAGVAPAVAWNVYFFHAIAGGYGPATTAYNWNVSHALLAFVGSLVSPNRGLLVFTPLVAFALVGAYRAARAKTADALLLTLLGVSCLALAVNNAYFSAWWGGWCYGPRYLTDAMPILGLLVVYAVPNSMPAFLARGPAAWAAATLFLLTLLSSTMVQVVGANSGVAGPAWNSTPVSIDRHPERVWDISDLQIVRNARAMRRQFSSNPTAAPGYIDGFSGRVLELTDGAGYPLGRTFSAPPDAVTLVRAYIQNNGTSRLYGYSTGIARGEARVRFHLRNRAGQDVSAADLFVWGAPAPGDRTTAEGEVAFPASPGTYTVVLDVYADGFGRSGAHATVATVRVAAR